MKKSEDEKIVDILATTFLAFEIYHSREAKDPKSAVQMAIAQRAETEARTEKAFLSRPNKDNYIVTTDSYGYLTSVTAPGGKRTLYHCHPEDGLAAVTEPDGTKYVHNKNGSWQQDGSDKPVEQVVSFGVVQEPYLEQKNGYIYATNDSGSTLLYPRKVIATGKVSVQDFSDNANALLPLIDLNHDKVLDTDELAYAVQGQDRDAKEQQVIAALYKYRRELGDLNADDSASGISSQDLLTFDSLAGQRSEKHIPVVDLIEGQMAKVQNLQRVDTSRELFPHNQIWPDGVAQGMIGDCYFLAALASVAGSDPELIRKSIIENRDGTYRVTFPGAPDQPITVQPPTDAELSLYASGSPHGIWAAVMEKAYGQYCQGSILRLSPFNLSGGNTSQEGADGGGVPARALELLTAKSTDSDNLAMTSKESTVQKLTDALGGLHKRAVVASISPSLKGLFSDEYLYTEDNFAKKHAYSILDFEPDGKGGGLLTVRNPWDGTSGTPKGTIKITVDQFLENFSNVTYSTEK